MISTKQICIVNCRLLNKVSLDKNINYYTIFAYQKSAMNVFNKMNIIQKKDFICYIHYNEILHTSQLFRKEFSRAIIIDELRYLSMPAFVHFGPNKNQQKSDQKHSRLNSCSCYETGGEAGASADQRLYFQNSRQNTGHVVYTGQD